jgi:hypothetical protein
MNINQNQVRHNVINLIEILILLQKQLDAHLQGEEPTLLGISKLQQGILVLLIRKKMQK